MTGNSSTGHTKSFRDSIVAEATRVEEDARYASKSHYNDVTTWTRVQTWLGLCATMLGAAAGATGLFTERPGLAGVIAFLSAGTTAVLTFQKPAERASNHQKAGAGYGAVVMKARQLKCVDSIGPASDEDLRSALQALTEQKALLDADSPNPSPRAFSRARRGIEQGEATHAIDQRP